MGQVQIGNLYRRRTMKKLNGDIIDLVDEADGGWIIRKGQVVNQEKFQQLLQKEEDRRKAAQAITHQVSVPDAVAAQRAGTPGQTKQEPDRVSNLEQRVNDMDGKLDAILQALKK